MLLALRKKRMSTLTKHLIAGGTGLVAGGATYGTIGWLSNKYAEAPEKMRANIAKSGLPLEVVPTEDGYMLRTTADYKYKIGNVERTIKKGFLFDGTSGPVLLRPLFGGATDPRTLRAGLEHDHEYRYPDGKVTRAQADDNFVQRAIEGGLPEGRAKAMGFGLKLSGWLPYMIHKSRNK
jgi:hypothetical protein